MVMALRDVIGQERALRMLRGAVMRGRMASSYLFAGEDGIGKRHSALGFAKALNCLEPIEGEDGFRDACGHCRSCHNIDADVHPDVLTVEPLTNEILVCQIRAGGDSDRCSREKYEKPRVEDMLSRRSHEGGYKVVIIDQAEKMNGSAANAFLKTLEEPPPRSIIMLVSSRPDMLLPTIRSRCSRVNFRPLPESAVAEVLGLEANSPIVRLAMGSPGAVAKDDEGSGEEDRRRFFELLKSMLTPGSRTAWKDRGDIEAWLDMAVLVLRDMTVFRLTGDAGGMINSDMGREIGSMCRDASIKDIINAYTKLRLLRVRQLFNLQKGITWNYTGCILGNIINV